MQEPKSQLIKALSTVPDFATELAVSYTVPVNRSKSLTVYCTCSGGGRGFSANSVDQLTRMHCHLCGSLTRVEETVTFVGSIEVTPCWRDS